MRANFVRNDIKDTLGIGLQKNIEVEAYRNLDYMGGFPLTRKELKRIYNITIGEYNEKNKTFILKGLRSNIEDYMEDFEIEDYNYYDPLADAEYGDEFPPRKKRKLIPLKK